METPVEAWRISVPPLKDNFKDVLQRKKFKHARHQKNDLPPMKMDELEMKLQKLEQKIDNTREKIDILQVKIDKPLKKNDIQLEKNINSQEKNANPLGKSVEAQENSEKPRNILLSTESEKPIRKREKESDKTAPSCQTCHSVKSKTSNSDQPGLRCGKTPRVVVPSVSSISQSVNRNCRHCCFTLGELFKEVCKTIHGEPNSKVGEMLNEISDILIALANDCVLFIRRIGINTTSCISKVARPMQEYITCSVKRTQKCASDKISAVKDTSRQYAKKVSNGVTATIDKTKEYAENACNGVTETIDKTKQYAEKGARLSASGDKPKHQHAANALDEFKNKIKQKLKKFNCQKCESPQSKRY